MEEKPRILIVEDEWIVANDIQTSLQKLGYEISAVVASGEEAIQEAENKHPDLILMDIVLQGKIDGIEAAREINLRLDIPVIYLTAYSERGLLEQAKRTEPFGYMIKPFRDKELHTTIEMALFKHQTEKELKETLGREISSRKKMEEQIQASKREKALLIEEINHRVKNNMQVVYGLLDIQSGYVKDKQYVDVFKGCQNRIMSMALVHEQLHRSEDLTNIDFKAYVQNLVDNLYRVHGVSHDRVALKMDVGTVSLGIDIAIPCGLIINELVSNSLKHAFPERRGGEIRIGLVSLNQDELELSVSDNGIGMPPDIDLEKADTFGLRMLVAFAEGELAGRIGFHHEQGTEFRILFKA